MYLWEVVNFTFNFRLFFLFEAMFPERISKICIINILAAAFSSSYSSVYDSALLNNLRSSLRPPAAKLNITTAIHLNVFL